ncbi:MAG: PDZ domain-containing protein [Gemmatimonadetes bacterium]|nr:PDZ domain-containing protein [Gemmatimonadota bacterium]
MRGSHTNHHPRTIRLRSLIWAALMACLAHPGVDRRVHAQTTPYLHNLEREIVSLVERVEPTVASVIVQRKFINTVNGQTFTDWERSIGTGVVLHRDGFIITTAGVVDHAHDILVNFRDGSYSRGHLVGVDRLSDIAVIRVDSLETHTARLGNSDDVLPGSWVLVLNNAHGFPSSMTTGIVNGLREEDVMIQVSAVVGSAYSGGAVFSTNGRLLGLVADPRRVQASGSGNTGSDEGRGLIAVIPINRVKTFARQLIEYGEIRRSWLGVHVEKIWESVTIGGDRNIMLGAVEGMVVSDVYPDSPAMEVGLRKGDVLQAVNGVSMNHPIVLAEFVTTLPVGTRIEIKFLRGDVEHTAHTVLAAQPKPLAAPAAPLLSEDGPEDTRSGEDPRLIQQMILEHERELAAHRIKLNQLKRLLDERMRLIGQRSPVRSGDDGF